MYACLKVHILEVMLLECDGLGGANCECDEESTVDFSTSLHVVLAGSVVCTSTCSSCCCVYINVVLVG